MNRSRIAAVATLLALGTAARAADLLTLDQAIRIATGQNRNVQNAVLEEDKAEDRLAATRTRQLPNFNLYVLGAQQLRSFDFTLEKGVLGEYQGGPLPANDVHLTSPMQPTGFMTARVTQPLTSLIKIHRNMDALKTGIEIAKEQTRGEQQKVVHEIKRIYYSLQQVDSSLRTVRQTAELYAEIEKLTNNYVIQEVALRGDLLQARTRVAQARQRETQLLNEESSAKEQLNRLLGRDVLIDFEVQQVLEETGVEPNLDGARARALADRPEIRQAALRIVQAEQDLRAKKAERIPDIAAEFNNMTMMNFGAFLPVQSSSVGVSLTWEPFDWGRKKYEASEKQRTVSQAELAERDARNAVIADVNDRFRQLRYRRGDLLVARLEQDTAVENLRVVKNRFSVQAVLVKDVLQAQVSLEQSNATYQQALTDFWNARADFERAIGEDQ